MPTNFVERFGDFLRPVGAEVLASEFEGELGFGLFESRKKLDKDLTIK